MKKKHWIIDTKSIGETVEESCLFGFLYGVTPPNYADYILREAKRDPDEFLLKLNGGFCGFVYLEDRIIVFNDRYGYGKVYLCESPVGVIVGSSFNDIVRRLQQKTPDVVGLLEFLRFGYPLYDRTFLKEIRLLPPGTRFEIDRISGNILCENRYWHYEFVENQAVDRVQMRNNLWESFENAVEDCFADPHATYAVGNSGGLDSRSIIAIARSKGFDFVAYTYGSKGSDAMHIANKISKTLNVRQENIDIATDFLPKYYEIHQERRPMVTLASSWYYSGIERLGDCTKNVTGMYGDNTFGIHLVNTYLKIHNDWEQYNYHSLADDGYLSNLTPLCYDEVKEHYNSILATYNQPDQIKRFDQWNFENRQFRFIMEEGWVNFLDDMEMRCPFMHNDVVDFAFTIPFEWRRDRKLYKEALECHYPAISRIRFERSPYNAEDSYWSRVEKSASWRMAQVMGKFVGWNPYFHGVHKHQQQWLMSEPNYSFIEENLRRPSRLFADLFYAEKIASNVQSMLATNWSVTSNLLTIKLWLERFVEGVH